MKHIKLILAALLLIAITAASTFALDSSKCFLHQDPDNEWCFYLEILEYGEDGIYCPAIQTNPAFNWCMARVVRDYDGDCCKANSGHSFLVPSQYIECLGEYASGTMTVCRNVCIEDEDGDWCKAKYFYNGQCTGGTCYPQ